MTSGGQHNVGGFAAKPKAAAYFINTIFLAWVKEGVLIL